jgi:hypothetical protein
MMLASAFLRHVGRSLWADRREKGVLDVENHLIASAMRALSSAAQPGTCSFAMRCSAGGGAWYIICGADKTAPVAPVNV